jgi:hypothetical protein
MLIIKVPGMKMGGYQQSVEEWQGSGLDEENVLLRKHRYSLTLDSLPPNVKNALAKDKWVTITAAQFTAVLVDNGN